MSKSYTISTDGQLLNSNFVKKQKNNHIILYNNMVLTISQHQSH